MSSYSIIPTEKLKTILEKAYKYEALSQYGVAVYWYDYNNAMNKYKTVFCSYHGDKEFDSKNITFTDIANYCVKHYPTLNYQYNIEDFVE